MANMNEERRLVSSSRSPNIPAYHPKHRGTKKEQILSLFNSGITDIEELADLADCRSSYVASTLQSSGLLYGYFDLYTHTSSQMNIYSKFFQGRLGFKNEETAKKSVELIENFYQGFRESRDRAGQHHALMLALTMFDRARWSGKSREAGIFKDWLMKHLTESESPIKDFGEQPPINRS